MLLMGFGWLQILAASERVDNAQCFDAVGWATGRASGVGLLVVTV